MTAFSKHTVQLMANHIITQMNNATLKIYGAGSAFPRHITHPLPRCAVEFAQYQLAAPCGVFDDSSGKSRIVFTPPTRISSQNNVEGYPNFFRIYSASNGETMYQGACRVIDYLERTDNFTTDDNPITNVLKLRPILIGNDVRYSKINSYPEFFNDGSSEWRRWPRWVDIQLTSFSIDFGGAV